MKIALQQLEQQAAKSLAPMYWISGDETLLVQEALDFLRQCAQKKGFTERTRIPVESNNEWGELLFANAHSLSLFAEQRILELDLRGAKLNAGNSEILQKYAQKPAENTLLLIYSHKLDAKTEQTKWYKAIEKQAVMIPVWPVTIEQLPQWLIQRAKKAQLTLTKEAAVRLAHQVEGNLLAAAQEIEKLSLLQPQATIDEHALDNIIANHTHFDVFHLVDSILIGNRQRALHILQNLLAEEIEPVLILWALTRELTTLSDIYQALRQGTALSALFGQFRIWEKRQPPVRAFLKRASIDSCWDLLLHAAQIDRIIKGADKGNVRDELERLVLAMAGV